MSPSAYSHRDLYWLIGFGLAVVVGIAALSLLVFDADPSGLTARVAFIGSAGLTIFGAGSFLFYRISFAIFDSRRYRGNLSRAAQQGLVLALLVVVGLALQLNQMLDEIGMLALVGLLIISEIYLLLRA